MKRRAKVRDKIRYLRDLLEHRLEADENRIKHGENFKLKLVSMLGDIAKEIVDLKERLVKLENVHKNRRKKIDR